MPALLPASPNVFCQHSRAGRRAKPPARTQEPSVDYDSSFNNSAEHLISCFSSAGSSFSKGMFYLHERPQQLGLSCFGRLHLPQQATYSISSSPGPEKFKTITVPWCQPEENIRAGTTRTDKGFLENFLPETPTSPVLLAGWEEPG